MSLEQKIEALTAILTEQVELQKALVEGQKKAVALMGSGGAAAAEAAKPARTRKSPDPTPTPETKVAEPAPAAETPAASEGADPAVYNQAALQKVAGDWLTSLPEAKKQVAKDFAKAMGDRFGLEKFMGPTGLQDPDDIKKAMFWIDRKRAGLAVDFNADYDYDGSPEQGAPGAAPAAAAEDDDPFA